MLQICSLMRGGIAERGGIRVGHRIIEINGQSVVATPHDKIIQILTNAVGEVGKGWNAYFHNWIIFCHQYRNGYSNELIITFYTGHINIFSQVWFFSLGRFTWRPCQPQHIDSWQDRSSRFFFENFLLHQGQKWTIVFKLHELLPIAENIMMQLIIQPIISCCPTTEFNKLV